MAICLLWLNFVISSFINIYLESQSTEFWSPSSPLSDATSKFQGLITSNSPSKAPVSIDLLTCSLFLSTEMFWEHELAAVRRTSKGARAVTRMAWCLRYTGTVHWVTFHWKGACTVQWEHLEGKVNLNWGHLSHERKRCWIWGSKPGKEVSHGTEWDCHRRGRRQ